jgi:hypothetical protein
MILAHPDAPIRHGTTRIGCGNFVESLLSLFVLERVKPGDSAVELRLGFRRAGSFEVYSSELVGWFVTMTFVLGRRGYSKNGE